MIVFATRARQSDVPSMRSSRRKRSSGGSPFAEHNARDFVTFEVRSLPSSRGSIRAIDPGRNLFVSLQNEFIEQTVSLPFRTSTCDNQGERDHSLAQHIAIPQRFCEQSSFSLFSCHISALTELGRTPVRRSATFSPCALESCKGTHAALNLV
jgi:hypothetical protein